MPKELPTRIDPAAFERSIYTEWETSGAFHADETTEKPPYSIVIPPPNVTGSLHMGHALNNTLQDILTRFARMTGHEALWMPGMDHAGIATQNVVERQLAAEGKSRHDVGREAFIQRVWTWKEESGGTILNQLKRLGASCDWERQRFTMDDGLSAAVRKVFVTLYKEDLIYRSNYLINWCPRCHTALSDLEVEHDEKKGNLYNITYRITGSDRTLTIATTRPETMLGDTAVAVHPDDERYADLVGKTVTLPFVDRDIPIIADEYVDMAFGTGALKVTPAHDPNDFLLGKKHQLAEISMMDDSGIVNENGGKFQGMERFEARKQIVEELSQMKLLGDIDDLMHNVGHCYRCKSVVEPMISLQWFVKIEPLAKPAIEAVKSGDIRILPQQWENTYFEWMYNLRDWCISRQIWWGHRIPAWYCADCGHITVAEVDPDSCEKCGSKNIEQETDVLDTWFSSALWPFSTMGWPEKNLTLDTFYPTSVLVTGFDILFFWVARMIMMGLKFMDEIPFKDVYIHALVRDAEGQKMSKSKGNVIDPLTVIDEYGADALRFTLAAFAAQGRDIKLSTDRIEGYRNFVNKIWNASRFVMMNLGDTVPPIDPGKLHAEDLWILQSLRDTSEDVAAAIREYRFNDAASSLYGFFWHRFCDWYIELIKPRIFDEDRKDQALAVAASVLSNALVMLHPIMPFLTEYIFQMLTGKQTITTETYPSFDYAFGEAKAELDTVIELISLVRNIRGEYNVSPGQQIDVQVNAGPTSKKIFEDNRDMIVKMARLSSFGFTDQPPADAVTNVARDFEVYVPMTGLIDVEAEIRKLEKEKKSVMKDYQIYGGKLKNDKYLNNAPAEVIEKDKAKLADVEARLAKIEETLGRLKVN